MGFFLGVFGVNSDDFGDPRYFWGVSLEFRGVFQHFGVNSDDLRLPQHFWGASAKFRGGSSAFWGENCRILGRISMLWGPARFWGESSGFWGPFIWERISTDLLNLGLSGHFRANVLDFGGGS